MHVYWGSEPHTSYPDFFHRGKPQLGPIVHASYTTEHNIDVHKVIEDVFTIDKRCQMLAVRRTDENRGFIADVVGNYLQ